MSNIAFLGAGAMGEALMRGLIAAKVYEPQQICAFDSDKAKAWRLHDDIKIRVASDAVEAVQKCDVVLLAVKPQFVEEALQPLHRVLDTTQTLVSIAAGISTKKLQNCFEAKIPIVRVMPNTPCLVGKGASAFCLGEHATKNQVVVAHNIFGSVGIAVEVPENLLDAVTGLSGSGPAYVYLFIEALSDAGVQNGLSRSVATQLAAQTVLGAAQMVLQTGKHPGELKDMVTSPGGTTIAAIAALEKRAFRGTVMEAVAAATKRSRELSGN